MNTNIGTDDSDLVLDRVQFDLAILLPQIAEFAGDRMAALESDLTTLLRLLDDDTEVSDYEARELAALLLSWTALHPSGWPWRPEAVALVSTSPSFASITDLAADPADRPWFLSSTARNQTWPNTFLWRHRLRQLGEGYEFGGRDIVWVDGRAMRVVEDEQQQQQQQQEQQQEQQQQQQEQQQQQQEEVEDRPVHLEAYDPFARSAGAVRSSNARHVRVPVWFATDRKHVPDASASDRFGAERNIGVDGLGVLTYGQVTVSIPDSHRKGHLEKPKLFKLEFRANPDKHLIVQDVNVLEEGDWFASIRAEVSGAESADPADTSDDILLFVHGYNTSWEQAALRAAQFTYDLEFRGLPVLFSWPSLGKTLGYPADEASVAWAVPHLVHVLGRLMSDTGARRIHIIAHSMGNRATTGALDQLMRGRHDFGTPLRELVFAAPDIDAGTFRQFITDFNAALAAGAGEENALPRLTMYACGVDSALDFSDVIHRAGRAGQTTDGVIVIAPMETVVVTDIVVEDQRDDRLGHAYFCTNRSVIGDLFGVVLRGAKPSDRFGLKPARDPVGEYWLM